VEILRSQSGFDGSVDNVSVVEDLSGDFTFSRSSAATRVNAQGLVENVQILSSELVSNGNFSQIGTEEVSNGNFSQEGSELVTNGDFSNGLTNWYVDDGTSWTNVNNTAFCDGNNGFIAQNHTSTQNKVYKVTFDSVATNSSGKELGVRIASGTYAWNLYPTGTHTIYLTAGSSGTQGVLFYATGGWTGSIDNVSVKEVTGQEVVPDSGCGSWLLEPQSTNLTPYSEDFSQSAWVKTGLNITSNSIASPSGEVNADKLVMEHIVLEIIQIYLLQMALNTL
jgi:hypothetical protein